MALQRHICLLFSIINMFVLPIITLCSCLQEDSQLIIDSYPSLIKQRSDSSDGVLSLRSFDKLGTMSTSSKKSIKTINVGDFGATGDGNDDTEAFKQAWDEACASNGAVLVVPKNNYLLRPIRFSGPCKSNITLQINGKIEASSDRSDYSEDSGHWLIYDNVNDLSIEGGGTIDGNGKVWWQNSCKVNKALPCKTAPTALTFYSCNNLVVKDLTVQNSQQIHVSIENCNNVYVSNVIVNSPGDSPNTDGIHVTATENIVITDTMISSGDDCISIVNGTQDLQATNISCGPGHGISIGSLGSGNSEAYVSGVTVNGAKLSGTANGVRIKTWQGGSGSASNIKFENIEMENVENPIIIDQSYCDQAKPCKQQSSAVQIKGVLYKNIQGTSASNLAINFNCSKTIPCKGIFLQNVKLETTRGGGSKAKAFCNNVNVVELGSVSPHCP